METWYCAKWGEIEPVQVSRETDKFVWVANGFGKFSQTAKASGYDSYFKTWAEAHAHLLGRATAKVDSAQRQLDREVAARDKIAAMKEQP